MLTTTEMNAMTCLMKQMIEDKIKLQSFTDKDVSLDTIRPVWQKASAHLSHDAREDTKILVFRGMNKQFIESEIVGCTSSCNVGCRQDMRQFYQKIPLHILVFTKRRSCEIVQEALHRFQLYASKEGLGVVMKGKEYRYSENVYKKLAAAPEEGMLKTLHVGYFPEY